MLRSRLFVAAICVLLCGFALAGCGQQGIAGLGASSQATDAVASNRQYMSDVNQAVEKLADRLNGFTDAVSRADLVSMRTQADAAYQVIDELQQIEAPEDLTQLQQGYVEACNGMKDALNSYIDLYAEISDTKSSFDYDSYADRIADIQKKYDGAIEKLKSTDDIAVELKQSDGTEQNGSSSTSDSSSSSSNGS